MDDWDNESSGTVRAPSGRKAPKAPGNRVSSAGSLHIGLTVAAIIAVAAVSFGLAFLMRNNPKRSTGLLMLTFAVPVAALMVSTLLVEKRTSAMTPSVSRSAQAAFAVGCVLLAGVVGLCCQKFNSTAELGLEVTVNKWKDTIILLDKSSSMRWDIIPSSRSENNGRDRAAVSAVNALLSEMPEDTQVGLINYHTTLGATVPLGRLGEASSDQRKNIDAALNEPLGSMTNYNLAMDKCLEFIADYQGDYSNLSVVMISDGYPEPDPFSNRKYMEAFGENGKYTGVTVNYIKIGNIVCDEMESLVAVTNGKSLTADELEQLKESVNQAVYTKETEIEELDALREVGQDQEAMTVVGILMALMGLLVGVSLTVMFSVHGQKRFQCVLSPLMAVAAFLMLAFGDSLIPKDWIREGVAFSLLGIVLMRKNRNGSDNTSYTVRKSDSQAEPEW